MKILFDAQQVTESMTGVGHYTDRVLSHLLDVDGGRHEWEILCHEGNRALVQRYLSKKRRASAIALSQPAFGHYTAQHRMLTEIVPKYGIDCFFSPSFLAAPRGVCPSISVVHDATFALFPEFYGGSVAEYLHDCVTQNCREATRVITMSDNSRRDLEQVYRVPSHRLSVVPLAADAEFSALIEPERIARCRARYHLPERYVLAVNMGSRKKDAPTLFQAFAQLPDDVRAGAGLVVVGEWSPDAVDLAQEAKDHGIVDRVVLTGYVPREDLAAIYAGAEIFCFPSRHEGFGLPVLEAMAAGVPVVCSDAASVPEVAGDAAMLFETGNPVELRAALSQLLGDPVARRDLAERGKRRASEFSWQRTARETLTAIDVAMESLHRPAEVLGPEHRPVFDSVPAANGLTCVITVDDVRPEPGFGGERDADPLGYLRRLHDEFGCSSTLFVPTNWKGEWPVDRHLDWLTWLLACPGFEVACHGHFHAVEPGSEDPGEFRGLSPERLEEVVQASLKVFAQAGHRPSGVKAPGWFLESSAYSVFSRHFSYVADHVQGLEATRLRGADLVRIPYYRTIDETFAWPESGLVVLQSHIAPEGRTLNGWSETLYQRMRSFVQTGKRIGARFVTLAEYCASLPRCAAPAPVSAPQIQPATITVRREPTSDPRLRGGEITSIGTEAGVLYHGDTEPCRSVLRPENATVAILSRNRRDYLADLMDSIDRTGPAGLDRMVLLNNCVDDSRATIERLFPTWRIVERRDQDYRDAAPPALEWLKRHAKDLLPRPADALGPETGWNVVGSIAWLRNQEIAACNRDFFLHFDDDFVVQPGWWEYYETFQSAHAAYAVFNNFGAFVLSRAAWDRVGMFDERYLASHGYEDLDYAARIAEAKLRWVLGFNPDHDWRSAEQGNPRGSMTGADYFIHRYAYMAGGWSARRDEGRSDPIRADWNGRWYRAKWEETKDDTGIYARPPFTGTFLRRRVLEEPRWPVEPPRARRAAVAAPGVKIKENTPVDEIDPIANPATGTMVDRYVFASHWCKGKRVIDAACGHGYGSAVLLALGAESVLGLDLEPEGLAFAEKQYAGPRVCFRSFDLTTGTVPPTECGETVVSIETMEHLPSEVCEAYLRTLRRLVAPGGSVFITTPRRIDPIWQYRGGTHRYEYSPEEFRTLVSAAFAGASLTYHSIYEFRLPDDARLHSDWRDGIDDRTRIMIAVATGVPAQVQP